MYCRFFLRGFHGCCVPKKKAFGCISGTHKHLICSGSLCSSQIFITITPRVSFLNLKVHTAQKLQISPCDRLQGVNQSCRFKRNTWITISSRCVTQHYSYALKLLSSQNQFRAPSAACFREQNTRISSSALSFSLVRVCLTLTESPN